jgi:hypothetical protein
MNPDDLQAVWEAWRDEERPEFVDRLHFCVLDVEDAFKAGAASMHSWIFRGGEAIDIAKLDAELASRDKLVEEFKTAASKLTSWLAQSHAYQQLLLSWMEKAQGRNIPPEYWELVKEAREELTKNQNAFLKEFGDMNEPGKN